MNRLRIWWRRSRHVHTWAVVGYGGCGWHLFRCSICHVEDIG
jgi:hypothetical protein